MFVSAAVVTVLILIAVFYSTQQLHLLQQKLFMASSLCDATRSTADHASLTINYIAFLVQKLVYILIVTVFVGMRLGTLRIHSTTDPQDPTQVVYNHRETDERVFEVLLFCVYNFLVYNGTFVDCSFCPVSIFLTS